MTLHTRFIVRDPVANPREVFDFCQTLIESENPKFSSDTHYGNPGWSNQLGQGFCAWLDCYYGPDGGLLIKGDCECEPPDDETGEEGYVCSSCKKPDGYVQASFDTAYGYQGDNGEGCGTLHATIVAKLGLWCDERNLAWSWYNEFTGEWHDGTDGLLDLCEGGVRATEWFRNEVVPFIQSEMRRSVSS